jgi:hypothetical protein
MTCEKLFYCLSISRSILSFLSILFIFEQAIPQQNTTPNFIVVPGSTQKICQLTGEYDYHQAAEDGVTPHERLTQNRTFSKYGIHGTDLGASFEHDGKLWFLFGDTFATETIPGDPEDGQSHSNPNPIAADATAFTTDTDPTDGISLEFLKDTNNPNVWLCPSFDPGGAVVQHEGFSIGNSFYVWYSSDEITRSSTLARSDDGGRNFTKIYDMSSNRFLWISVEAIPSSLIPGLENVGAVDWLFIFGTGPVYRQSDMFLAVVPVDLIEDAQAIFYFTGLDENNQPLWSQSEEDVQPIIDIDNPLSTGDWFGGIILEEKVGAEGCIGEFSVHYCEVLETWIAMYNLDFLSIEMHTSQTPWGPWSETVTVFDPIEDGGYCGFLHLTDVFKTILNLNCDYNVTIPGRAAPGSPYGPYIMERYTTGNQDQATLYFVMSMWHPYNVLAMKTTIQRDRGTNIKNIKTSNINHFYLSQNHPNPFNSSTTIRFNLPSLSEVSLKILNVRGQEIETIIDKKQMIGLQDILWDSSNSPSGVYVYQIETEDFIHHRKLLVLK